MDSNRHICSFPLRFLRTPSVSRAVSDLETDTKCSRESDADRTMGPRNEGAIDIEEGQTLRIQASTDADTLDVSCLRTSSKGEGDDIKSDGLGEGSENEEDEVQGEEEEEDSWTDDEKNEEKEYKRGDCIYPSKWSRASISLVRLPSSPPELNCGFSTIELPGKPPELKRERGFYLMSTSRRSES